VNGKAAVTGTDIPRTPLISRGRYHLLYAVLAFAAFGVMVSYSGYVSLWYDELCQVFFSGMSHTLTTAIMIDRHMPPLYTAITFLWYRIAPYGEVWLRLPSAALAAAVYIIALCGERTRGGQVGLFAGVLAAANVPLILNAGQQFRPYALFLLLAAMVLYLYLGRQPGKAFSPPAMIGFGVYMALTAYTHYFGILFCGMLFLADISKVIMKKQPARCLLAYAMAGALYLPWAVVMLQYGGTGSWQPVPSLHSLGYLFYYMNGKNRITLALYALGCAGLTVAAARSARSKARGKGLNQSELLIVYMPIAMTAIVFLFARYIAWRSTFWVNRYFFGLMPCVIVVSAIGVQMLGAAIRKVIKKPAWIKTALCCLLLALISVQNIRAVAAYTQKPFETAERIYVCAIHIKVSESLASMLSGYEMVEEWPDIKLYAYKAGPK
jgi:uncharacterized membrane protein